MRSLYFLSCFLSISFNSFLSFFIPSINSRKTLLISLVELFFYFFITGTEVSSSTLSLSSLLSSSNCQTNPFIESSHTLFPFILSYITCCCISFKFWDQYYTDSSISQSQSC
ncbi:hypothetical protein L873DRAFT_1324266 [Choiromyces venosus 120613-1]|uniref:Uncharacterized protein n=1 Tax=Choiromyces venosus 120613-1 TaxID=1336337 RepID=A0A3N4JN52_9PEZI|nr:hypothetical protein L873DRAFT_1324266 [Choiromyces venosus 120613-1]